MPNKTDRILSYLPGTFRTLPKPVVLYALINAFGQELLTAENSLAEVMAAHWVDYADRGELTIHDLEQLAALYGLAPRRESDLSGRLRSPDENPGAIIETVEEFREHLKHYIRIFLDGTVTVQGLLRVTAEALSLRIADTYEEMDCWWNRSAPELITSELRREDAAQKILGTTAIERVGQSARPAQIKGMVDLKAPIYLEGPHVLRLRVDQSSPVTIDLTEGADSATVSLSHLVERINQAFGGQAIARAEGSFLVLTSPTLGPSSRLEVMDGPHDAAEQILGIVPHVYRGQDARPAQVTGLKGLSNPLDLRQHRYLRLEIDRTHRVELDCAHANPDHPDQITPQQVCDAINQAFGIPTIATLQNNRITLTSPTAGFGSSIAFQRPAAEDATSFLLGSVTTFHIGQDDQPARIVGRADLSSGVDLSDRANLRFRLDGAATFTVNCAGANPQTTQLFEIVNAINEAAQEAIARQDGRFITLQSPRVGATSEIRLESAASGDAADLILGIGSRTRYGSAATAADLIVAPPFDRDATVNLMAETVIALAIDGGTPVEIDLSAAATDAQQVTLPELAQAINSTVGAAIASTTSSQLILTSPTIGGASRLAIMPLEQRRSRRFVTRTPILDEATQAIFGVIEQEAQGAEGSPAQIVGTVDLSRGVDLQTQRYLRLQLNELPAVEINCAGQRPRVTLIHEIVDAINTALKSHVPNAPDIASHDGQHLILTAPSSAGTSRIVLEPPQLEDARDLLLGWPVDTVRGQDPTRVTLIGTVDLSKGISLPAQAAIKIGVDDGEPITIALTGAEPAHKALDQLLITINSTLNQVVAQTDGTHLILFSGRKGETSRITFATPEGTDVTSDLVGFSAPRTYHGTAAQPAEIMGQTDLGHQSVNLKTARFLRLTVDPHPPKDVDCAAVASNPEAVTLDDMVRAINQAFASETIATHDETHLILRSPTVGLSNRITVEAYRSGDARSLLLGAVDPVAEGIPPTPAVITSQTTLTSSVNLSDRRVIRLSVDGDRPVDIEVVGTAPANTFVDEIVTAINAVFPDLASVNDEGQLQLTSPTTGAKSSLSLMPLRYLELIEYPADDGTPLERAVRHGDRWSIDNSGAAEAIATITLKAPQGAAGPTLVNTAVGWQVRLSTVLGTNDSIRLQAEAQKGIQAQLIKADGTSTRLDNSEIAVGPLGTQIQIPFSGDYRFTQDANGHTIQLNNPHTAHIVRLRALTTDSNPAVAIQVRESIVPRNPSGDALTPDQKLGRVRIQAEQRVLVNEQENPVAILRPGPFVELSPYLDQVVSVKGPLSDDETPVMVVQQIDRLFDVTVRSLASPSTEEHYTRVTIGREFSSSSLTHQLNADSRLVVAEDLPKATVLKLPQGRSIWSYLDCYTSRFNQANFNQADFAGGLCAERGVFNISRFTPAQKAEIPPDQPAAVFVADSPADPAVLVRFEWTTHRPGRLHVNLPADLPPRFGGRFNQARFSHGKGTSELYPAAVLEETGNPDFDALHALTDLINDGRDSSDTHPFIPASTLVKAERVDRVPLGWTAVQVPFRKPRSLTLGRADHSARLYLREEGVDQFLMLEAREPGDWGNDITVSVRPAGPAIYDVAIAYHSSRFENARAIALGSPLPALTQDFLKPGPFGVLQAKAAGVQVNVTRDACE